MEGTSSPKALDGMYVVKANTFFLGKQDKAVCIFPEITPSATLKT